ncbi:hypothetical protein CBS101457_006623 [Exobasidium rhododendri]|nr:hypothetical protein CBS101457_006623 [Exobasidium rhododendri]
MELATLLFRQKPAYASSSALLVSTYVGLRLYSPQTLEHVQDVLLLPGLIPTLALTFAAPLLTSYIIHSTKDSFLEKGFGGRDLLKGSPDRIPESIGLPVSLLYCMLMFCFIPFRYGGFRKNGEVRSNLDGGWSGDMMGTSGFPHHELATYLSSMLSLISSIMLGFLDDIFDIRWRLKMPIPILASLPMLVVYRAGKGGTSVVVPGWPSPLRLWLGSSIVDLGPLYYIFILMLSIFSVHSINILAGINGVEVGQALIIALSLCCNDILYLDPRAGQPGSFATVELRDRHLFSLALLLPFCGCCVGLLSWNRYPAKVFVGDTFCYFAGQLLACAGVLGHFSKTLLLFFVPQLINFGLSLPQLAGLVPCPRHRVPSVNLKTMSLHPSVATFSPEMPAKPITVAILRLFAAFRLARLQWDDTDKVNGRKRLRSSTNLTLLNAILVFRGVHPQETKGEASSSDDPKSNTNTQPQIDEPGLWRHVMLFQIFCSLCAFGVRYWLAAIVFP